MHPSNVFGLKTDLSFTTSNYEEAIASLKAKFGEEQVMINKHMEILIKCPWCHTCPYGTLLCFVLKCGQPTHYWRLLGTRSINDVARTGN